MNKRIIPEKQDNRNDGRDHPSRTSPHSENSQSTRENSGNRDRSTKANTSIKKGRNNEEEDNPILKYTDRNRMGNYRGY